MKKVLFLLFIIVLLLQQTVTLPGCANIVPPQGGPKDTIPPVLLSVNPTDSSKNFKDSRITFTFDEFVDVQNLVENLIVSPLPQITPQVDPKLKTVTVRLKDSLEENTTYTIDFGNAIKDFTEGNPAKNLTYTFSTGNYFDSLELKGNVIIAETGKVDTTLIVMLHTNPDDSIVIKEKPRYIAKLDGKGNFHFKNLPQKPFYLYALKDEGNSRRYFNEQQIFAFADSSVMPGSADEITLYAYSIPKASPLSNLPSIGGRNKQVAVGGENRLNYQTTLQGGLQDLLKTFEIKFEEPLKTFDDKKINLFTDSAYNPVPGHSFILDSTGTKISLQHSWKENTLYHLVLEKDFAEDSSGRKLLKDDTLHFATRKRTDYGSLKLRLRNIDTSQNPVLQFLQNDKVYQAFPLSGENLSVDLFTPGEYQLRILFDRNKNGVWDPGNFFGGHIQPETVQPIDRKLSIKANWKNEFEIEL
ncbi:MAG: Ig-like domain-containing protein [Chitinophagaceae bacterium]|nr:Ig-like domain-containing protein [Chitinophagaceae bacterium]